MEALAVVALGFVFGALGLRAAAPGTDTLTPAGRERNETAKPRRPVGASPGADREATLRRRAEERERRNHARRLAALAGALADAVGDEARVLSAERMLRIEQARHEEKLRRLVG